MEYFSDRERGPIPPTEEEISPTLWAGIASAVGRRIGSGAFGHSYPSLCPDGGAVCGVDVEQLGAAAVAEIPDLALAQLTRAERYREPPFSGWPLVTDRIPPTLAILDLIEFCHLCVADPVERDYHSYFSHHHLDFDVSAGRLAWRTEVNRMMARNGVAYEIQQTGRVERVGTPLVTERIKMADFVTGDQPLDDLLDRAREKYLDADPIQRLEGVEKLWDAFERAKTLRDQDKKAGVQILLDNAASSPRSRELLEDEARALTGIGNSFRIRHHETTKTELAPNEIDLVFHRCFAFLAHVLDLNPSHAKESGG